MGDHRRVAPEALQHVGRQRGRDEGDRPAVRAAQDVAHRDEPAGRDGRTQGSPEVELGLRRQALEELDPRWPAHARHARQHRAIRRNRRSDDPAVDVQQVDRREGGVQVAKAPDQGRRAGHVLEAGAGLQRVAQSFDGRLELDEVAVGGFLRDLQHGLHAGDLLGAHRVPREHAVDQCADAQDPPTDGGERVAGRQSQRCHGEARPAGVASVVTRIAARRSGGTTPDR
ncbi:hypothetical protein [uncultured Methylibium sp.]|uniref:hypothetical protein n=1 Tax=uncultured Methylibium sp. TaxID=381093 RepID=UPI0025F0314B|nr:hypothetical protein [uncultured Methylibium sp.]